MALTPGMEQRPRLVFVELRRSRRATRKEETPIILWRTQLDWDGPRFWSIAAHRAGARGTGGGGQHGHSEGESSHSACPVTVAAHRGDADSPRVEVGETSSRRKVLGAAPATAVAVLWAIPAAALSYALGLAGVGILAPLAGIGMTVFLRWILPILRIDTSLYKRRDWVARGATFLISWLVLWLLLLNAPFAGLTNSTVQGPTIDNVTLGATQVQCNVGATYTFAGTTVLTVIVSDTVINVTVAYRAGTPIGMNHTGGNTWETIVPAFPLGSPTPVFVVAHDAAGRTASCAFIVQRT